MDRPVGSGYGSGLYILTRSQMDHCSDPLGTESHNVQLDKKKDLR